jgi:hypothetical protein
MPTPQQTDQGIALPVETDRLMEEINILRLEGSIFCFDRREAKRRRGKISLVDARKQPISIEVHPDYGQPSILAYKVLQAIFLKLTEEGCMPTGDGRCMYPETVSFSQRELAALAGRSWGGKTSHELYDAIQQLQSTKVIGSLYDKGEGTWHVVSFVVIPSAYFAGRGETLTRCSVRLASEMVASINRRHVAFFNLYRLSTLDTLGLVLYKRVFFHLSNLNVEHKRANDLRLTKNYAMLCREWLGGLKPQRYKADIVKQLGAHLQALKATHLIRRYTIEKNAAGDGFNITFYPGRGFFEDYRLYYLDHEQPRLRFKASADQALIQKPLELVAFFHRTLGRTQSNFAESETVYADELLASHTEAEIRDLVLYAVAEAEKSNFDMLYFGALKRYLEPWRADTKRKAERQKRADSIKACPHCNEHGFLELRERGSRKIVTHPCPHNPKLIKRIEDRLASEHMRPL